MIAAAISAVAGVALAAVGVYLIRAAEVKPGDSAFSGLLSSRSLTTAAGWVALFLGLFLAMVGAPMIYLR